MSLYAPPRELSTSVFSRLPEEYCDPHRPSGWIDTHTPGKTLGSFLEGPTFDLDGNLYVTDIPHGRIFRISSEGSWALVTEYDGWPNGLCRHRDGRMFVADHKSGIMELDPDTGQITPVLTGVAGEAFKGVNDLTLDRRGQLFFTDQGLTGMQDPSGRVFRLNLDTGELVCLADTCPSPNGLVLSPDETVLYVAMTRSNSVWRLPILPDGSTQKVGIFVQLAGGVSGADGMAVDADGNLCVCDAGNGCVWMFSQWGEPLLKITSCTDGRATTNIAYGVHDTRRIYVTESASGTILQADLEVPGHQVFGLADT